MTSMSSFLKIVVLIALTIPFLIPFFKPGYIETDDGLWAIVRQSSMHRELRAGQFPVRWSGDLNFGYGYPLFNFSYPGPYYVGELFHLIGFNFTGTVKVMFVISTILSVIGMYFFIKELWKSSLAGYTGALMYLASEYRFINLYFRGSLGETMAFALFPLLCLSGLKLFQTGKRRYLLIGSLLLALLILTHNVMAFLFIPFFFYFLMVEIFLRFVIFSRLMTEYIDNFGKKFSLKKNIHTQIFFKHLHLIVVMIILGLCLSSFFWLPAISELKYTRLGTVPLTNIAKELSYDNILGPSAVTKNENIALQLRKYIEMLFLLKYIIFILVTVTIIFNRKTNLGSVVNRAFLYTLPYIILTLLLTPLSYYVWKYLPGMKVIDFPWRIFGLRAFIYSIVISSIAMIPRFKYLGVVAATICLALVWTTAFPQRYINQPDTFYSTNQATTTSASEYISVDMKNPVTKPADRYLSDNNDTISYKVKQNTSTKKEYEYTLTQDSLITTSTMYFPGWEMFVDGKEKPIEYKHSNGVISANLPAGSHTLTLSFKKTSIRLISEYISAVTAILLVILFSIHKLRGRPLLI